LKLTQLLGIKKTRTTSILNLMDKLNASIKYCWII